jgi:hypothetical protein
VSRIAPLLQQRLWPVTLNPTNPSQALTVEQAVGACTRGSAFAESGHLHGAGTAFPHTSVVTIVNGRPVYESKR